LCWNIRGLNATEKHDAVRDKIKESACSIICLQETKIQNIDMSILQKFVPQRFDKFDFSPSNGASGIVMFSLQPQLTSSLLASRSPSPLSIALPPGN